MRIGELAKQAGVSIETVRFYEAKALLQPAMRLANNYRTYGTEHLKRLHFIRHCRLLGMGLDSIDRLVHFDASSPDEAQAIHALIHDQVNEVSERIAQLKILREKLLELALHCTGKHQSGSPCGIMSELCSVEEGCCDKFGVKTQTELGTESLKNQGKIKESKKQ